MSCSAVNYLSKVFPINLDEIIQCDRKFIKDIFYAKGWFPAELFQ